ncbi:aminopeptidase [Halostella pelagica]|uniref:aminopeptidase n=1 Tax=Halostella pelagica TaxID=2583824 RepID=UPI001081E4BF|nr:aminopeptidase [Halostella pelagica]
MDPRVREHAEVLVDTCVDISEGDEVVVSAPSVADDLTVALYEKIGERGAIPSGRGVTSRATRAYMRAADEDDFQESAVGMAMSEAADAFIGVRGATNTFEKSDVDPGKNAARRKANEAVMEKFMENRWVATQYPAPANAQDAEMSTEAYEDFVWSAVNKDWDAQREHQEQLVEILDPASEVRIVSGDETDISMNVDGMIAENDWGDVNMPAGEVFTAPVPDSVEGTVLFDMPVMVQGREVDDVRLTFEGGEVVEHSAGKNEDLLTTLLETDEGARRIGELGIGMNRDIDRFTYNMLFDEKMGDTVHMAIGRAYEENVPEDRERNQSVVHEDMIVDMSEDSYIEIDGEVIQRDGTFRFEDGFEG